MRIEGTGHHGEILEGGNKVKNQEKQILERGEGDLCLKEQEETQTVVTSGSQ